MTQAAIPEYLRRISLPTPFPVGPVNVYVAEGAELTLVDSGPRYGPARQALAEALREQGHRVDDLERIVLTHGHADHCGLAAELARRSGARVWMHPANAAATADRGGGAGASRLRAEGAIRYARMMRWFGTPLRLMVRLARMRRGLATYGEPLDGWEPLRDGDVIDLGGEAWQVLHTPGHAGGLICLYHPQRRLLLSSDHLLAHISSNPVAAPRASGEAEPPARLVQYMEQLRRVAELDVILALPGHGPPITHHRDLIERRLRFHEERAERMVRILDERTLTAHQLAAEFFPNRDTINGFLAVSEVVGHLQWLRLQGRVEQEERWGVAYWRRAT